MIMKPLIKGITSLIIAYATIWIPTYIFVCIWGWEFKPWALLWIFYGWISVKSGIYYSGENKHAFCTIPIMYIGFSAIFGYIVHKQHSEEFETIMIFVGLSVLGALLSPITYKWDN